MIAERQESSTLNQYPREVNSEESGYASKSSLYVSFLNRFLEMSYEQSFQALRRISTITIISNAKKAIITIFGWAAVNLALFT